MSLHQEQRLKINTNLSGRMSYGDVSLTSLAVTGHFENMLNALDLLPKTPPCRVGPLPRLTGPIYRVCTVEHSLHSPGSPASTSAPSLNSSSDSTSGTRIAGRVEPRARPEHSCRPPLSTGTRRARDATG